jgi:hypothetical protein
MRKKNYALMAAENFPYFALFLSEQSYIIDIYDWDIFVCWA